MSFPPQGVGIERTIFDANTILKADTDNTPVALAVAASRLIGRKATGSIAALTQAEVQHLLGILNTTFKDYTFTSRGIGAGTYYLAGFYDAPAAEAALNQGGTTVNHGTANIAYGAHAFVVAKGDGAKTGGDLVLTVTGDSVQDDGTLTPGDSQVIVADATLAAFATDAYFETSKKWVGTVTFTLSSSGGGAFNCSFNYGLAKYEDYGNESFTVRDFETVGLAGQSDAGFNVKLLHHKTTGWTYDVAAFVPGSGSICNIADYGANDELQAGEYFAYKRAALGVDVDGDTGEGVLVEITQTANNTIQIMDVHIGVDFDL